MNQPRPSDPRVLIQKSKEVAAANRYAFQRKQKEGNIVNTVLSKK